MKRDAVWPWRAPVMTVFAAAALATLAGCDRDGGRGASPPPTPTSRQRAPSQADDARHDGTVRMRIGGETFTLEVAATDRARQIGLMHRRSMPQDHGMIFAFPDSRELGFWMKNTLIPLDIIYLDGGGKVVSIRQMKPLDERRVESGAPAKYAIELNAGAAKRAGVNVGDVLAIPAGARDGS